MTRPSILCRVSVLACVTSLALVCAPSLLARSEVDVTQALDLYNQAQTSVLVALAGLPGSSGPLMLGDLKKRGPAWIKAMGPAQLDHRRLVMASFSLEAARGIREHGGPVPVDLVEFACDQLRASSVVQPGERWFQLGAISLLESGAPYHALETHLWHAQHRLNGDARVQLAGAFFEELDAEAAPSELNAMRSARIGWIRDSGVELSRSEVDMRRRFDAAFFDTSDHYLTDLAPRLAIDTIPTTLAEREVPPSIWRTPDRIATVARSVRHRYEQLRTVPAVAAEAQLRLGYLDLVSRNAARALTEFAEVARSTDRQDLKYLAYLFSGWAQERQHALGSAEAFYRQAIAAAPNGRTARLWLATVLQAQGRIEDAQAASEASLRIPAGTEDPWRGFGEGDLLPWSTIVMSLRASLQ